MRIEIVGRLYAFNEQKKDEIVFRVVPKGGYRGSAHMLKALLVKHRWSQEQATEMLQVSQSALSKYITGKRTMLLRVALDIERLNTGKSFDTSWQSKHEAEKLFQWWKGHISLIRIEARGKVYAYDYRKDDQLVFKAVRRHANRDGELLKELRKKYRWTQEDAGEALRVSQPMIAKYESGERLLDDGRRKIVAMMVRLSLEELKQWLAYRRKMGTGKPE